MSGKRIRLNGLERQLFSLLLKIETGITKQDENLDKEDLKKITEFCGKDFATVQRFFYSSDQTSDFQFNSGTIDSIIKKIESLDSDSWEAFRQKHLYNGDQSYPGKVPKTQLVPYSTRVKIEKFTEAILSKIYHKDLSPYFPFLRDPNDQEISPKLADYLDKSWYAYFFFPYSEHKKYGQIIRTIIRVQPNKNIVETIRPEDEKLDIFEGRVRFDKKERVLIYDMVTKKSGSRAAHIKQVINIDNFPKITLGEYSNIGLGGNGLHSIRLIMEHIGNYDYDREKFKPKVLSASDPEFFEIPETFRKYIQFGKDNFRECTTKAVTSIKDLEILVKKEEETRFANKRVKLRKKFQAIFSFPRFYISDDDYAVYQRNLLELKDYLEAEFPIEVDDYFISRPKPRPVETFEFLSDRVRNCDLIFGFIFHEQAQLTISELTLGCESRRKLLICTKKEHPECVPIIFRGKWPEGVRFLDEHDTLEEAIEDLKSRLHFELKDELEYYNSHVMPEDD